MKAVNARPPRAGLAVRLVFGCRARRLASDARQTPWRSSGRITREERRYFHSMKPANNNSPSETAAVFALDAGTDWEDLLNAMEACINYQSTRRGKILPLMFFAPLTEPENLDAWEPMKTVPENLLVLSLERKVDLQLLQALEQAAPVLGAISHAATCQAILLDFKLPLADVYAQMTAAGILAYTYTQTHKDDPSYFFLRGVAAVRAFDKELRRVTDPRRATG